MGSAGALILLSLALSVGACAQSSETASAGIAAGSPVESLAVSPKDIQPTLLTNYVESGGNYMTLSNGLGIWSGGYARTVVQKGDSVWNAEMNGQRQFGDSGVYFDAGDTYTFNSAWYGSLTAGSSVGGFFWPRFRMDGFLNRKWLSRKQWITTLGVSYDHAKDVHWDRSFFVGTTYYFDHPWIIEEGVHFNISNPGRVFSSSGFIAITQGKDKQHYVTVRGEFGREAYQLIGPTAVLDDFPIQDVSLTWRKWIGRTWGVNFVGEYFHSPYYVRGGSTLGFFKDF